jgi:urease accessory protein
VIRASARIVAVADGRGGTRLAVLRGQSPVLPRRTGAARGPGVPAEVHLVGGAAGPLGGDLLRLDVEVGPDAALCLRTVAATVVLPGPDGAGSRMEITASVAAGGRLDWLPEPLVAAAGCRHESIATVAVADGGRLCWREEVICGRHGERPGDLVSRTTVRYAGRTLHRQDLAVGPSAPGWDGPAVLGDARATGSVLVVEPAWADSGPPAATVLSPTAAALPLVGPGLLITATADPRAARAVLDAAALDAAALDAAALDAAVSTYRHARTTGPTPPPPGGRSEPANGRTADAGGDRGRHTAAHGDGARGGRAAGRRWTI